MGEILGLGVTHYPGLVMAGGNGARLLQRATSNPDVPEAFRQPENWPNGLRAELGDDEGVGAVVRHKEALVREFAKARKVLDEFAPDFVLVWGDDQFENFREDIIPPFAVLAYDQFEAKPFTREHLRNNPWGEPWDKSFAVSGHPTGAKNLTTGLLSEGFDVAYSYKPLHHDLGHAFINTVLFFDWDRKGFPYPLVPFSVNCYGRRVISWHGQTGNAEAELDPPSPMPWRCFDLGAAIARVLMRGPWRVALVASSSWSHGFLTSKNHYIYPDLESDRQLYAALCAGDYEKWRNRSLESMEASGQQEMLNWMCLVGAMSELDRRPDYTEFIESYINNSPKCFAYFRS